MAEPTSLPFQLPALCADATSETGVVLMGLDAEHLVAALGAAALTTDAAVLVMLADRARHRGAFEVSYAAALAAGVAQWRGRRAALRAADPGLLRSGAPREAFTAMLDVARTGAGDAGPALRSCLAACWFRREEIDGWTDER